MTFASHMGRKRFLFPRREGEKKGGKREAVRRRVEEKEKGREETPGDRGHGEAVYSHFRKEKADSMLSLRREKKKGGTYWLTSC